LHRYVVEHIDRMLFPDSGRFRGIAIVTFATAEVRLCTS
jgi:hypothetical protein